MSLTSPDGPQVQGPAQIDQEAELIAAVRRRARARRLAAARALASRVRLTADGRRTFVRFSRFNQFEHQLLIVTFSILALTGLLQRYSEWALVGWTINTIFGGVETLRTLHHLAAAIFILEAILHAGSILVIWFVKKEQGAMWPRWRDLLDLLQMLKHNLGQAQHKPAFDRFNIEEKIEYWALLWGSIVMILTGLVQWFPTWVTTIFPGVVVPVSRTVHGWEALLATLSIIIWHLYHTVIKERNTSIFTGVMSEEEMEESHPLEHRRILAAVEFLKRAAAEKEQAAAQSANGQQHEPIKETEPA